MQALTSLSPPNRATKSLTAAKSGGRLRDRLAGLSSGLSSAQRMTSGMGSTRAAAPALIHAYRWCATRLSPLSSADARRDAIAFHTSRGRRRAASVSASKSGSLPAGGAGRASQSPPRPAALPPQTPRVPQHRPQRMRDVLGTAAKAGGRIYPFARPNALSAYTSAEGKIRRTKRQKNPRRACS